jgi:hypothetical protein
MSNARENVNLLTSADWDIPTLRLANWGSGAVPPQVVLKTSYVTGDGGGLFRYDASDTTTADNGGTVIVDTAGNRWKRQYAGALVDAWFSSLALACTAAGTSPLKITSAQTIGASITITCPLIFEGGSFSVSSTFTATINGGITADEERQIFSGAGLVVLGAKTVRAVCEWWGGGRGVSSGAAINKMIAATASAKVPMYFFGGANAYTIETNLSEINPAHPINCDAGATFNASGATTGITFSSGNGGIQNLPSLSFFTTYALKLKGSSLMRITCAAINICGDAIIIETINATHATALDNNIYGQIIGTCTNGIRFIADNAACVQQGNDIDVNFIVSTTRAVFFDANGIQPNWDRNSVTIAAIDPTPSVANARALVTNALDVPALTFTVHDWLGGFNTSTGKYIEGNFNALTCRLNFAESIANYAMWALTGASITIKTFPGNGNADTIVTASASAASRATFNSGAPITNNRIRLRFTLLSDLTDGSTRTFYAYHPFANDGTTEAFLFVPRSMGGAVVSQLFTGGNPNEIAITLSNSTGATIVSGTNLDCYLSVGLP